MMKLFIISCIISICIVYYGELLNTVFKRTIVNYYTPVDQNTHIVKWNRRINYDIKKDDDLPNIILVIADDLGFNDLRDAPNINSLHKNGIKFTRAYAGHATCAPSRASLFTGRFPTKLGFEFTPHPASLDILMHFQNDLVHNNIINMTNIINNPSFEHLALQKNVTMISDVLRNYTYKNYFVGKWHLGEMNGYRPLERGYDESIAFLYGASMYGEKSNTSIVSANIGKSLFDTYLNELIPFGISHNNNKMFKPDEYMTDYLSKNTIDIIKNEHNSSHPFFITLAYNAPHNPYQALKSDYDQQTGTHREKIYKAMIKSVDRGIGNIIQTLKDEGKYDNTLIVFTSDNGGTHLIELDDINHPYSGWKCTFYEGGIRVPMLWQWPNKIKPNSEYDGTVSHIDIFATLASLVNYNDPEIDGVNLLPYINGKYTDEPHETLFWRSADYKSIKVGDWKLSVSDKMDKHWLYDLHNDPTEYVNLMNYVNTNETLNEIYNKMYIQLVETNNKQ